MHGIFTRFREIQENRPAGSASDIGADGPRKYLIGGNWKCNGTWDENAERVTTFNGAGPIPSNVEVALCVPDINIPQLLATLRKDIAVGAQNSGVNAGNGAYTGETGSHQLKALGVTWVIIGHSERREGFGMAGETPELCAKKCKVAIDNGLKVMFVSDSIILGYDDFSDKKDGNVDKVSKIYVFYCLMIYFRLAQNYFLVSSLCLLSLA